MGKASRAANRLVWLNRLIPCLFLGGSPWLSGAGGADVVDLRERLAPGAETQVRIELQAEGLFRPSPAPESLKPDARLPRPLALDVKTRLMFRERLLATGETVSAGGKNPPAGQEAKASAVTRRAVRRVTQAASAINGEIRPTGSVLRPELALLVAERAADGSVVVTSPAGPLTRSELELVQGLADPLTLADFLPREPVAVAASWKLSDAAAASLTGYDTVRLNALEATLQRSDERSARIRLHGKVEGSVLGGPGAVTCEGFLDFDREAGMVSGLDVRRAENRQAGPVEAGIEVKSTVIVQRRRADPAPELADAALRDLPLESTPQQQLLQLISPDGKYNLLHDRRWHIYWEDPRLVVLKRLADGKVIAQCNLAAGPAAGKGRHQDLAQFREDIQRSLKPRFVQLLGAGEVDGDPAGGFRYKVGVKGREGDVGVLWYYYLLASPEGEQVLATFTLAEQDATAFGPQDLEMIGSLQWSAPAAATNEKGQAR